MNEIHDYETIKTDLESLSACETKKPYSAPRILSREPLETIAVACVHGGAKAIFPGCAPVFLFS
jgi:hypothetical protein